MNNNYETELEDLKKVYENAVKDVACMYENKLHTLLRTMKDFISAYENKKTYEKKLEVLDAKLNYESSGCNCCDDEEGEEDDE